MRENLAYVRRDHMKLTEQFLSEPDREGARSL